MHKKIMIAIQLNYDGKQKKIMLKGMGDVEKGYLEGKFSSVEGEFTTPDQIITSAFTFTGCPIVARNDSGDQTLNPWVRSSGAYSSQRTLTSNLFEVNSHLKSKAQDNNIEMSLDITVDGNVGSLTRVQNPFQEVIRPTSNYVLHGTFPIEFQQQNGLVVPCLADSTYRLPVPVGEKTVYRNIRIDNSPLKQTERISLYISKVVANRELKRF